MISQHAEILSLMILKHLVFYLMEFVKKKNVVIIKVQIMEILFLISQEENVSLKIMEEIGKEFEEIPLMIEIHIIRNQKKYM